MPSSTAQPGRHMLDGTVRIFLAEALFPLTGIITAAFLSRRLGPQGYGLFILVATFIAWIEWSVTSLFSRAVIKCIGETDDWRSVGTAILRFYLVTSGSITLLLLVFATPIAVLFDEPQLGFYLQLFACDVLLFNLAQAQRTILVGTGRFRERAIASAGRSISRLLLIVLLVACGLSVPGAILGSIGSSLTELIIGYLYLRLPLLRPSSFPMRKLWGYALPLSLSAISVGLYNRMDIFLLKILGGTAEQAGLYGAAQNIAGVLGIFALSFAPLLLSTLGRELTTGNIEVAKQLSQNAMRGVLFLLPFIGVAAGAATEMIGLVFHEAFLPAAPLLAVLLFGALALVMLSVTTAIVTAAGKPNWTFIMTGPFVPFAFVGHLLIIPQLGPLGAALVTTVIACIGTLASIYTVYSLWRILPPTATLWRSALLCVCMYGLASMWPTPGLFLFVKLAMLSLAIVIAFFVLGEFADDEIALVRSLLYAQTHTKHTDSIGLHPETKGHPWGK